MSSFLNKTVTHSFRKPANSFLYPFFAFSGFSLFVIEIIRDRTFISHQSSKLLGRHYYHHTWPTQHGRNKHRSLAGRRCHRYHVSRFDAVPFNFPWAKAHMAKSSGDGERYANAPKKRISALFKPLERNLPVCSSSPSSSR